MSINVRVAWRERDWARWTDEERRRFYGSGTVPASDRARRNPVRAVAWGVIGLLTLAVAVLALYRGTLPAAPVEIAPTPIYGERGVPPISNPEARPGEIPRLAPGGSGTVCTAKRIDQRTGTWVCTEYAIAVSQAVGPRV
jgi:hypothetical protein